MFDGSLCAHVSLGASPIALVKAGFKMSNLRLWKNNNKKTSNAPLATTCQMPHYRGRPSNLPLSTALMSELPSRRNRSTKMEKRPMHKASACISHDSFMSNLPWLHVPCSPLWRSFIMPSHGERVRARLMYLCLEQARGPLHNQLVLLCPKYLIWINFNAAASSYLPWIDLAWITRIVAQI